MSEKYSKEFSNDRRAVLAGMASVAGAAGMGAVARVGRVFASEGADPIVKTRYGKVRGYREGGLCIFKGIPYGATTAGAGRFMPPRPPEPWSDIRDAKVWGPASPQPIRVTVVLPNDADQQKVQGEDCLVLNVWTPSANGSGKRPVMMWLHGGGFAAGSAGSSVFDGSYLASHGDTVLVSINHRLNGMGYLYLGDLLGSKYAASGNAGNLDIVLALKWISENIHEFGGDPGNVTVFGESGGGAKVSCLMAMPSAAGLFHNAVIQSGAALRAFEKQNAAEFARQVVAELKIEQNPKAILDLPPKAIFEATAVVTARNADPRGAFSGRARLGAGPVVDGVVLLRNPCDPDAPAQSANIPLMIGHNGSEATLFLLSDPLFGKMTESDLEKRLDTMYGPDMAKKALEIHRAANPKGSPSDLLADIMSGRMVANTTIFADRKSAQGRAPVYYYVLEWETPERGGLLRSPHALDLSLVFNTISQTKNTTGTGPDPQRLADQMSATWLAFARHGDPNNSMIPTWPKYNSVKRDEMAFNLQSHVVSDPKSEVRQFWMTAS